MPKVKVEVLMSIGQGRFKGDIIELESDIAEKYNKAKYTKMAPAGALIRKSNVSKATETKQA